eukprot:1186920-Rhodomonas_salina.5
MASHGAAGRHSTAKSTSVTDGYFVFPLFSVVSWMRCPCSHPSRAQIVRSHPASTKSRASIRAACEILYRTRESFVPEARELGLGVASLRLYRRAGAEATVRTGCRGGE